MVPQGALSDSQLNSSQSGQAKSVQVSFISQMIRIERPTKKQPHSMVVSPCRLALPAITKTLSQSFRSSGSR
jgi:hypothetical protein